VAVCATTSRDWVLTDVQEPDILVAHVTDEEGDALRHLEAFQHWAAHRWPRLQTLYIVMNDDAGAGLGLELGLGSGSGPRSGSTTTTFQDVQAKLGLGRLHVQHKHGTATDPRFAVHGSDRTVPRPHFCRGTQDTPCGCFEREYFCLQEVLDTRRGHIRQDRVIVVDVDVRRHTESREDRIRIARASDITGDMIKQHCRVITTATTFLPSGDILLTFQGADEAFMSLGIVPIQALLR
jgi:hypothetical protein